MFNKTKALVRRHGVKVGVVASTMFVGASAHADLTALTTAITAKVSEAETFGYSILAIGLVASIGMALVKKFARAGAK